MMVAIAHAAPTAPAPIIPIFMMSSSVLWIFSKGGRAQRRARASPRARFVKRPAFSRSEGRNRAALVKISRMGSEAQSADENSCVKPYATSYREHFE
jgi:hypothetical protein